ncbi:MAG: DUF4340 domain-containing protein [Oscillospiraceae bacterium]|jgi:hypothetical protein|nr:DUF4340 domain-containing protein [Oscillospiraceae bacterium]
MKKNIKLLIGFAAAALVLGGILVWLVFFGTGGDSTPADEIDYGTDITVATDDNGMNQAPVKTHEKGEIENNSYGTLLALTPIDIKEIDVNNQTGNFTIEAKQTKVATTNPDTGEAEEATDATVYTLKGYEDFALQSGMPDAIANDCAALDFKKVASLTGEQAENFGLDKPRAEVTVRFADGTTAKITLGAANKNVVASYTEDGTPVAGAYVTFGTSPTIYLVAEDAVDSFLYSINELFDLNINTAAATEDDGKFEYIRLSGENYPKQIELVQNTDTTKTDYYMLKSHNNLPVDATQGSLVAGGLRGLLGTKIVYVNPNGSRLEQLGLQPAFATAEAKYPDITVKLSASKPDADGNVNLYSAATGLVYQISQNKVPWVTSSEAKLVSKYLLSPVKEAVSAIDIDINGTKKNIVTVTKTIDVTDENGDPTTRSETTAKVGGKELETGVFDSFYSKLTLLERSDYKTENSSKTLAGTIKYSYKDGYSRKSDLIELYSTTEGYTAVVNGIPVGTVLKSKVDDLLTGI